MERVVAQSRDSCASGEGGGVPGGAVAVLGGRVRISRARLGSNVAVVENLVDEAEIDMDVHGASAARGCTAGAA